MKTTLIKQEILLMIIPFSKKEVCGKDIPGNLNNQSYADQLEEVCWDCSLDELIDNIFKKAVSGGKLCFWHVQQRTSFVGLELCYGPQFTEQHFSIDPYSFLPTAILN